MTTGVLSFRQQVRDADQEAVRALVRESGFFSPAEVDIAVELVSERLLEGDRSGYFFLFAEQEGRLAGYSCFGPIPGSEHSYDLYWIAVESGLRRRGIGRELLSRSEDMVQRAGGKRLYVDTSSRPQYESTVTFYLNCGYRKEAFLEDFYAPGDGKIILAKAWQ